MLLKRTPVLLFFASAGSLASAQLAVFHGSSADEAAWRAAAGGAVPIETFEGYVGTPGIDPTGDPVALLPDLGVTLETNVLGVFPGVYADANFAHSGVNQLSNFGAGAPPFSDFRLRPVPGKYLRAIGFWQCDPQGDQVVDAFAFNGFRLGSITARANDGSGGNFAGFLSNHPVAYVRFRGNFGDGYNHIDDLQIVLGDICPVDLAVDNQLDFYDVQAFLSWFAASDPRADLTQDGVINFFDVQAYLQAYSKGCPW